MWTPLAAAVCALSLCIAPLALAQDLAQDQAKDQAKDQAQEQAAPAAPRAAQVTGIVLDVDEPLSPLVVNAQGGAFWQWEFSYPGANYLRVQFRPVGLDGADLSANLSFWDQSGRLVRRLGLEELRKEGLQWSDAVDGDYVLVTFRVTSPAADTAIDIRRVAVQNQTSAALSIIGDDDTEDIVLYRDSPLIWELQSPVARLLLIQDHLTASCTGFMVSDSVMMTNFHCVRSQLECDDMKVQFNYYMTELGRIGEVTQRDCIGFDPQLTSEQLDYAFVRVEGKPGVRFGTISLDALADEAARPIAGGSPLLIIQHPAGLPKKIARTNCLIAQLPVDGLAPDSDFSHSCDTLGGSSGSPVFNEAGMLVGLHHYGFAEGGSWSENRAIRVSKIIAELAASDIRIDQWPTPDPDAGPAEAVESGQ